MSQKVVTRFAPSPTGFLHIGGVRTAIFNYLYAKHNGGEFRLRIEDTDKQRSTQDAVNAILDGLSWMGLQHDGEVVFQSAREDHHKAAVKKLLASNHAYKCFMTAEELTFAREQAQSKGQIFKYDRRWRDRPESDAPSDQPYSVRFKMPMDGETLISDAVQGDVRVQNEELDDLVIQRADGTPTYNLAVVVDDHDMGVTQIIRGDDHLNNAFRQHQIYLGLGWTPPKQAHVPLIHGHDGAKMSKRHGALGVEAYRDLGYLKPAIFNYLLRLGWSHGDEEIFSEEMAIELFDIINVNKAPSRFDVVKLASINSHYLKQAKPADLVEQLIPFLSEPASEAAKQRLINGMPGLVDRASDLKELAEGAQIYLHDLPPAADEKAAKAINEESKTVLVELVEILGKSTDWTEDALTADLKDFCKSKDLKMGAVFMPLRAALTGTMNSPAVPEVAVALGQTLTLQRIKAVLS